MTEDKQTNQRAVDHLTKKIRFFKVRTSFKSRSFWYNLGFSFVENGWSLLYHIILHVRFWLSILCWSGNSVRKHRRLDLMMVLHMIQPLSTCRQEYVLSFLYFLSIAILVVIIRIFTVSVGFLFCKLYRWSLVISTDINQNLEQTKMKLALGTFKQWTWSLLYIQPCFHNLTHFSLLWPLKTSYRNGSSVVEFCFQIC